MQIRNPLPVMELVTKRVENMKPGSTFRSPEFVKDFLSSYPEARKNTIVNALSILKERGVLIQDKSQPWPCPFYVGFMPK